MHPTAWIAGYLFYIVLHNLGVLPPGEIDILDMGSYDVNGNMKDCLVEAQKSEMWDKSITHKYNYYGLDHARGFNVDIVGNIADLLSRNSTKYHLIVTSSADYATASGRNHVRTRADQLIHPQVPSR
jgi:hypothetical protein